MISARHIVAQQGWRLIVVHNEDVHIAIVIEVAKGAPSAAVRSFDSRAGLAGQLFKRSVTQIAEKDARRLVWLIGLVLQFGVNSPGDPENVGESVVIQI